MKKLLALAIALIMVLALVPMTMAAELPTGNLVVGNGQRLTYDLTGAKSGLITIEGGGELTINGNGTYTGDIIVKNGKLTLNGGTYKGTVKIQGAAEVNIERAVQVLSEGWYGLEVLDCDNGDTLPAIKINVRGTLAGAWGGIATNGNLATIPQVGENQREVNIFPGAKLYPLAHAGEGTVAIYAAGYMVWNISGGSFKGETCLSIKSGEWNITGGEFLADGEYKNPAAANNNGSEDTGAALSITSNPAYAKRTTIRIIDGTFVSEQGNALYEGIAKNDGEYITTESYVRSFVISDGTFYSEKEAVVIDGVDREANPTTVNFYGGTYSDNSPQNYYNNAPIQVSTARPTLKGGNNTLVKAQSEVAYIVIIPAVVDFGMINRNMDPQSQDFTVEIQDALLAIGTGVQVQVNIGGAVTPNEQFLMKNAADDTVTLPYTLYKADNDEVNDGTEYCTFWQNALNDGNNFGASYTGTISCDPSELTAAGAYTDTMIFMIGIVSEP